MDDVADGRQQDEAEVAEDLPGPGWDDPIIRQNTPIGRQQDRLMTFCVTSLKG